MENPHITVNYNKDLTTEATHLFSGVELVTDAPLDNNGKAASFSPTDLVASALVSCMLTVVAINYQKKGLKLYPIKSKLEKIMASNPRRIVDIKIEFDLGENKFTDEDLKKFIELIHTCPVANSLSEKIKITTSILGIGIIEPL